MSSLRSRHVVSVVVVGSCVMLGAADGAADPPPPLQMLPSTHLASFRLAPSTPAHGYAGGAIALEVDVVNTAAAPQGNVVVKVTSSDGTNLSQTTSVGAKATKTLSFGDASGLTTSCHPKKYVVTVTSSAGTQTKPANVTPSCKTETKLVDPWNLAVPDRVEEVQETSAYVTNASVASATCGVAGLRVKAMIYNHTKISAASLLVQAKDKSGKVWAQTTAAFPLAAGAARAIELTPVGGRDLPDRVELAIVDWQKKLGSHVENQGITVTTTKSCSLTAGWTPPATLATVSSP